MGRGWEEGGKRVGGGGVNVNIVKTNTRTTLISMTNHPFIQLGVNSENKCKESVSLALV